MEDIDYLWAGLMVIEMLALAAVGAAAWWRLRHARLTSALLICGGVAVLLLGSAGSVVMYLGDIGELDVFLNLDLFYYVSDYWDAVSPFISATAFGLIAAGLFTFVPKPAAAA